MAQHPLIEAYQKIRFSQKTPFRIPAPQETITIPLDNVFFSYLNDALKAKTGRKVNYLFYQFQEKGNDSFGVHFEIDFEGSIVEVTDMSVIIWVEAPFYETDASSSISPKNFKFSELNNRISNIGSPGGLVLVTDTGASHTRKSGYGLTNIKYTVDVLLN